MKVINNLLFISVLGLSVLGVAYAFEYADSFRGYNATGSEVFLIALPIYIALLKLNSLFKRAGRKKSRQNKNRLEQSQCLN